MTYDELLNIDAEIERQEEEHEAALCPFCNDNSSYCDCGELSAELSFVDVIAKPVTGGIWL